MSADRRARSRAFARLAALLMPLVAAVAAGRAVPPPWDADVLDWPGCVPSAGDCLEAHGGRGCRWPECCAFVCEFVPECCDEAWDEFCAKIAGDFCAPPEPCTVDRGGCRTAHDAPGCEDGRCCGLVCAIDRYCCTSAWDEVCAAEAVRMCDAPTIPICRLETVEPTFIEPDECDKGAVNDGCAVDPPAFGVLRPGDRVLGRVHAATRRDVDWWSVAGAGAGPVEIRLTAEFPAEVAIVQGDCAEGWAAVAVRFADACTPMAWSVTLPEAPAWVVVAPGSVEGAILSGIPCRDDARPFPVPYGRRYLLEVVVAP